MPMSYPLIEVRGHSFFDNLGPAATVLDCGGNKGDFSRLLATRWGCRAWCVEPNPALAASIREQGHAAKVFENAISNSAEPLKFVVEANTEWSRVVPGDVSASPGTLTVQPLSLGSLIESTGQADIDLVKLDIEGAEIEALTRTDPALLRRVRQFTVEFHDHCGFTPVEEVESALEHCRGLGFTVLPMSITTYGDVVIYQPGKLAMGRMSVLRHQHVTRWTWALGRRAGKLLRGR